MSEREITPAATTTTTAAFHGGYSTLCRELTVIDIVDVTRIQTALFLLPEGWTVEKVPGNKGTRERELYYEPGLGTGRRFESMRAVERPLKGDDRTPSQLASKSGSCFEKYYERRKRRKVLPFIADEKYFPRSKRNSSHKASKVRNNARFLKLNNKKRNIRPCLDLPDGWLVEKVPRKNTTRGYTRKIYNEPGTGKKFRSLPSVKRHLAEEKAEEDKPLAVMFSISPAYKEKISREKVSSSTSGPATPPAKIKWVLSNCNINSGECTFKPFNGEAMVVEPVVQRWASRFMTSISSENHRAPNFERC